MAIEATQLWISRVWWLHECSNEFVVQIARGSFYFTRFECSFYFTRFECSFSELKPSCWPSREWIIFDELTLCIINKGLVVRYVVLKTRFKNCKEIFNQIFFKNFFLNFFRFVFSFFTSHFSESLISKEKGMFGERTLS